MLTCEHVSETRRINAQKIQRSSFLLVPLHSCSEYATCHTSSTSGSGSTIAILLAYGELFPKASASHSSLPLGTDLEYQ